MHRQLMFLAATLVAVGAAVPSVFSSSFAPNSTACQRLCKDGLGGLPCGCDPDKTSKQMSKDIYHWRTSHPEDKIIKGPRWQICPLLCHLKLGHPLCGCGAKNKPNVELEHENVCNLCDLVIDEPDVFKRLGCDKRKCGASSMNRNYDLTLGINEISNGLLEEFVDWNLWCTIQCEEGDGGIACNCDMLPLQLAD
ncbi:uncharacterized protein LOC132202752 [Neocloeon triangulifer]|uniref:uncharacterized protein LOC132202752 n=1 Tax=Neocloeon triangulifer TaxID=2078957 RepID=UPI00286F6CFB|nr:uncharacterized protein LOC132202752 [Neocloeon triangulifer]